MPDITCPECGNATELLAVRRSAEEFCRHCDYPLFWAPSNVPITTPGANSDATLRRLPGAGGRRRVGSKVCPVCGELNPMAETHCSRCTSELEPEPVVIVEAEPAPAPIMVTPALMPEPLIPWWIRWRWALIGVTVVTIALLIWWAWD